MTTATLSVLVLAAILLAATATYYTVNEAALNRKLSGLVADADLAKRDAEVSRASAAKAESAAQLLQAEATSARDQALEARRRHRELLYAAHIRQADEALRVGDIRRAHDLLNQQLAQPGLADLRGFEWHWLRRQMFTDPPVTALSMHNARCLRFSPDGRWLAVGDSLGVCWLLDAATKEVVRSWPTMHRMIESVSISPSSKQIATAGHDRSVCVWDVQTAGLMAKLPLPSDQSSWRAEFLCERRLAATSRTGTTFVFDIERESQKTTLTTQLTEVFAIAASPERNLIAQLGCDGVELFASESLEPHGLIAFSQRRPGGKSLRFSPSGKRLAFDDGDRRVYVYDVQDPQTPQSILDRTILDEVRGVDFSSDESQLAVCSSTGGIHIWSLDTESESIQSRPTRLEWQAHSDRINSVAYSTEGELVSTGRDNRLCVWRLSRSPLMRVLSDATFPDAYRCGIAVAPGGWLAAANDHGIQLWDINSRTLRATMDPQGRRRERVAISIDGKWLAAAGSEQDPFVEVWSLAELQSGGKPLWRLEGQASRQLMFAPDNRTLIVTQWEQNRVLALNPLTGEILKTFNAPQCWSAAFAPDSSQLSVASLDHIDVWDVSTGRHQHRLSGQDSTTTTVSYSPDGRWIASGSKERSIRLWEASNGRAQFHLLGHRDWIEQVAFSHDSRSLISLSRDGTIKVWHVSTGELLCDLWQSTPNRPFHIALSADGDWVAIRFEYGQIAILDTSAF